MNQVSKNEVLIIGFFVIVSLLLAIFLAYTSISSAPENLTPNLSANEKVLLDFASGFNQTLQQRLVNTFKSNGNVTSDEVQQVEFLKTLLYANQARSIENGTFVNLDWDADGMSNYFEQNIAHQPVNVYNGRYALLVSTWNDNTVIDSMYNFLTNEQKFPLQNVIKLAYTNATGVHFEQVLASLTRRVNGNDTLYVMLDGHGGQSGDVGFFIFNDGKGENQNVNPVGIYADIDELLDNISSNRTVVVVLDCEKQSALEPFKEGPSPRVVLAMNWGWLYGQSEKYADVSRGYPELFEHVKPKDFDKDHNGFVSVEESFEAVRQSIQSHLSKYPELSTAYVMSDTYNVSKNTYLGDFPSPK